MVASQEGYLYIYQISENDGGECKLIKKHNLRNADIHMTTKTNGWFYGDFTVFGANHFFFILESGQASGPSYASAVKGNSPPPSD